ncbi:MAG: hypothetical protein H0X59_02515 [Chloroflexi bacterium]|nr:hypothetical protein [Chloroflexota bacterium]
MSRTRSLFRDTWLLIAAELVGVLVETLVAGAMSGELGIVSLVRDAIGTSIISVFYTPVIAVPAAVMVMVMRYAARRLGNATKGRLMGICLALTIVVALLILARSDSSISQPESLFAVFTGTTLLTFSVIAPVSARPAKLSDNAHPSVKWDVRRFRPPDRRGGTTRRRPISIRGPAGDAPVRRNLAGPVVHRLLDEA